MLRKLMDGFDMALSACAARHASTLAFLGTFKTIGPMRIACYVLLSLAGALAGSMVAVLLVPLVQPGRALVLSGRMIDVHGSIGVHVVLFMAATMSFALLRWRAARLGAQLAGRYAMELRRAVHAHLIDARLASLADSTSAEIANVLTYNVEIITQGLNALMQCVVAGVTAVITLALAFWVSPPLALGAPLLGILALCASRTNSREQARVGRRYIADMTCLFWHSEDFPRRLRHVRSFGREAAEKASYSEISMRLGDGYRHQLELVASGRLMLELGAAVGIALIFVLAHHLRGMDQASLVAVCLLLGRLLPYLVSTRQSLQQLHSAIPAFELWQRYMRLPSIPADEPARAGIGIGVLHIEHVQLACPLDALEIRGLELVPGWLTVVAGDSGIGKSSLLDVLAGMTWPAAFAARVGKRSFGFGTYRELARNSAYISQSVRPWQRSVRECLLWAAPEATEDMLRRALMDVGLDGRLARDGLDTALDDSSSRFSGGELQRLLLAQLILRQPLLAFLDEATGALDEASELAMLQMLKRRLPQTIMVVVSHRSSAMAIADRCLSITVDSHPYTDRDGQGSAWSGQWSRMPRARQVPVPHTFPT